MAEPGLTAKLVQLTEHYLAMHLHDSAVFMAERLLAVAPSEANRHLLATALVHGGRVARACAVLRGSRSPANVYLLARYCIATGAYAEAESVLLESAGLVGRDPDAVVLALQTRPYALPNGAAGAYLLAWAVHRAGRLDAAARYYMLTLFLDPFNFAAFEALCRLGYYPHPGQAFAATRLTATGAFSDKPAAPGKTEALHVRRAGAGVGGGHVANDSNAASEFPGSGVGAPLAVPSPLLSPITPAAKLLLLSPPQPAAAAALVPPSLGAVPPPAHGASSSTAVATVSTPVQVLRYDASGRASGAAHTRPAPPPSALRSHPALAASLAGVASADRFGFAVTAPGEVGPAVYGDVAAALLEDISAISPVPPEFRNDGTALWSRVLGTSLAAPESGGHFGGGGGLFALHSGGGAGMRTEDFLRRGPAAGLAGAVSAFGTPASGGSGAGGRGRFLRRAGAVPGMAATGASGGSSTSAVRPFLLPPGSAATSTTVLSHAAAVGAAAHQAPGPGAALPAAGVDGSWETFAGVDAVLEVSADATSPDLSEAPGAATVPQSTAAAVAAASGTASAGGASIASPALLVPGPAGIIMAGKRKARYGLEHTGGTAAGPATAAASSAVASGRSSAAPGRGGTAAPPSTVARPRFKRLSFSAGDTAPAGGAAAGQALGSPQGARSRGGGGGVGSVAREAAAPPPHSPYLRRLRSHSDALAAVSEASPGSGSAAPLSPNPKGRVMPRAASARHIAGPAFIAAALKSGDDAPVGSAAAAAAHGDLSRGNRGPPQPRGTPTAAAPAPVSAMLVPRAPTVADLLQRGSVQLLGLLRTMGFAARHLARFECEAASATLAQLPEAQAESPWALTLRARAKYELGQHAEASRIALARLNQSPAYYRLLCRRASCLSCCMRRRLSALMAWTCIQLCCGTSKPWYAFSCVFFLSIESTSPPSPCSIPARSYRARR